MISGRRAYRRDLPHYQSDQRTYVVTFATRGRTVLPPVARTIALNHILAGRETRYFLHAAVVMPDHVHLLITPSLDTAGYYVAVGEILRRIKGASAREINLALLRTGAIWQHESFDHELRREEDVRAKGDYICRNPVRAGLVAREDDYPWLWRSWIDAA